jgi:hypothetical protein
VEEMMEGPSNRTQPEETIQTTLRCWDRKELVLYGRGKRDGMIASGAFKEAERK